MLWSPSFQDPLSLLPVLGVIFVLGFGWIALRTIFKVAMKVFAIGCLGILLLGAGMMIFSQFSIGG